MLEGGGGVIFVLKGGGCIVVDGASTGLNTPVVFLLELFGLKLVVYSSLGGKIG